MGIYSGFARKFRRREVDMHFSLSQDMITSEQISTRPEGTICHTMVTTMLAVGLW